jgi:hypothetical protein
MNIARIKELKESTPFRPFLIRTADGKTWRVPHEDFIWIPYATTVFVASDDGVSILDTSLIASVDIEVVVPT